MAFWKRWIRPKWRVSAEGKDPVEGAKERAQSALWQVWNVES